MQIAATLVKGKARIKFDAPKVFIYIIDTYQPVDIKLMFNVGREPTAWLVHNSPSNLWFIFMRRTVRMGKDLKKIISDFNFLQAGSLLPSQMDKVSSQDQYLSARFSIFQEI